MTRSLITGGFGFISSYLTPLLLQAGHEVILLDITSNEGMLAQLGDEVKAVRASVADWAQLAAAVRDTRPDIIFHAGALLPPASEDYPQAAFPVNIEGSYNVLEAAAPLRCGTGRVRQQRGLLRAGCPSRACAQ